MKIPRVKNFFFCFELRFGGLFLGWLGAVNGVLATLLCLYGLINFEANIQKIIDGLDDTRLIVNLQTHKPELKVFLTLATLLYMLTTTMAIFLLLGVYKRRRAFIKVWLIGMLLAVVFAFSVQGFLLSIVADKSVAILIAITDVFVIGKLKPYQRAFPSIYSLLRKVSSVQMTYSQ